jgi:hypothetical protein
MFKARNIWCLGLLIVLVVCGTEGFGKPTPEKWEQLIENGKKAEAQGDTKQAKLCYEGALAIADKTDPACDQLGKSLCRALRTEILTGEAKNPKTEAQYQQLVKLLILSTGHGDRKLSSEVDFDVLELGDAYFQHANPAERELCLQHSAELSERLYPGVFREELVDRLKTLANYYNGEKKYNDAIAAFVSLEKILERKFGPSDERVADVLNDLALSYQATHQYEAAKNAEFRCIKIAKTSTGFLKRRLPCFYGVLGAVSIEQGQLEIGKHYFDLATDQWGKDYGLNSVAVARSLFFCGQTLLNTGHYAEAELKFNKVVAIMEKMPTNPNEKLLPYTWDQLMLLYTASHQNQKVALCQKKAREAYAALGSK